MEGMIKMISNQEKGIVFNIQHYSIHDGPGIRTNVFLKGCPLDCLWCANPESRKLSPQLSYNIEKCTGCQACIDVCNQKAIQFVEGKVKTDRSLCNACGKCITNCPTEARSIIGKTMNVDEVYKEVSKDKLFYDTSGGGVTLTGGEVLVQHEFARSILKRCKENGIHSAIETCGHGKWEVLKGLLKYTDIVLYDLKHMNDLEHKKCTGVGNELILDNLSKLSKELNIPVIIRVPIIPGYNNSEENMHLMSKYILENVPTCQEVNLLPYHNFGEGKREQLGQDNNDFHTYTPEENEMNKLLSILGSYNIKAK